MSYLVLARKWRPQTFRDLVGQEHVAQTLRNAITLDRVAHAFLFTGARGVGKTTIARIMAKSLNCLGREGVSSDPCLSCAACVEIAQGTDPDVREIDGASNNGVDNIRQLQESLPYRPTRDRYKVVIIDEVHMLSIGAFNALLKTLEEPPPHVKFIFATTEVHKVPITILSRCQRYDFRLIPTAKIRERLGHILREEKLPFEDSAVSLVAREAAGSMRDALSLLDQVIAGVQGPLTGPEAARLLGVADRKVLYDLCRSLLDGDAVAALRCLDAIVREGYDLPSVARGIHAVLRDLVIARVVPDPADLLDVADEERADVMAIAAKREVADLERLFMAWGRTVEETGRSREPRWALEMAVVRLAHRPVLLPVEELMGRLGDLERRLAGGVEPPKGPGPTRSGPAPGGASGGTQGGVAGGGPARAAGSPPPNAAGTQGAPVAMSAPSVTMTAPPATTPAAPPAAPAGRFSIQARPAAPDAPKAVVASIATAVAMATAAPVVHPSAKSEDWLARNKIKTPEPVRVAVANTPAESKSQEPVIDVSGAAAVLDVWRALVGSVEGPLVPVLKGAVPLEVSASGIKIAIDARDSFFRRKLATPEANEAIAEAGGRLFGARPTVELVQGTLPDGALSIARAEENARAEERAKREQAARTHPSVLAVCEALGGEVFRVRLDGDPV